MPVMTAASNILSLDFGTKRIGLAIARAYKVSSFTIAEPFKILANQDPNSQNQVFQQILDICLKEKINQIVVGLSENVMAEKTKQFASNLATYLAAYSELNNLKVEFFDETLSSQEVAKKLVQAGASNKKRRGPIDHYAAAVILEEWMAA